MKDTDRYTTAQQLLLILPFVMRVVSAELRRTKDSVIPAHLGVLSILTQQSCNLSELAELHAVSLPTMSNTITKMVKMGWVERTRAEHDRRMLLLQITPTGQKLLDEITHQLVLRMAELLAPLSSNDQQALKVGMAVLEQIFAQTLALSAGAEE